MCYRTYKESVCHVFVLMYREKIFSFGVPCRQKVTTSTKGDQQYNGKAGTEETTNNSTSNTCLNTLMKLKAVLY